MRFVDREQGDVDIGDHLEEASRHRPLGGDIEQVERAFAEQRLYPRGLLGGHRGVERFRAHALLAQRLHLVAHQGDQRRDDDPHPMPAERWHLVADRLAGAGGKQHDGVPAGDDVVDDIALLPTEFGVAEDLVQDVVGIGTKVEQGHGAAVSRDEPTVYHTRHALGTITVGSRQTGGSFRHRPSH